jgi:hypothetical protein
MDEETPAATRAIVPTVEKTVLFYGDNVPVAQAAPGELYVPVRPRATFLELAYSSQVQRIRRDHVLADELRTVVLTSADGKHYRTLCLPLDMIAGWLFGIATSRVKPELMDKLDRYRRECFRVLSRAFQGELAAAPPPADLNRAEQALYLAEAVAALARSHLELDQRQTTMADFMRPFVQQTRQQLRAHEERIGALELSLPRPGTISEAQAAELHQVVKRAGMLLTAKTGANSFGTVWNEFYLRFQVTNYHNLPVARFDEALAWPRGWYEEATGEALPEQGRLF